MAADVPCHFEPLSKPMYVIYGLNPDQCPNPVAIIGKNGGVLVYLGSSQQMGKLVVDRFRLSRQTNFWSFRD